MQSAVPHVLATLERTHDPERVPLVVAWARQAGLQVSLDLIYGTPGESLEDWRTSVEHALAQRPDHMSAYALIVEEGTKLAAPDPARRASRAPDDDLQADMYELADDALAAAGYEWYEVSNWATATRAPIAPQPRLLARPRLVGRRPWRAQPRRRRALVEREAPGGLRGSHRGRRVAGGGPRDARRRDAAGGAGAAATRIREGLPVGRARRHPVAPRSPASSPTGSSTAGRRSRGTVVLDPARAAARRRGRAAAARRVSGAAASSRLSARTGSRAGRCSAGPRSRRPRR